jgi:hypothetical protein
MQENMTTNSTHMPERSQECIVTLELVAEEGEYDPALINVLGYETVAVLQQEGYTARPAAYTGRKGVEGFLVEFVITVQQVANVLWAQHVAIAEGIADLSGLVTIFGYILPMLQRMRQTFERQVGEKESQAHPIKITVEIDGAPLVIEASDIAQADAALKLALKYHSAYPATSSQVTTKSKTKVQGGVPARKRRPRR